MIFPNYSNKYSKHTYKNCVKFTILCIKHYLNVNYRQVCEIIELSSEIRRILRISKVLNYSTLQKFFKKLSTIYLPGFNEFILSHLLINAK